MALTDGRWPRAVDVAGPVAGPPDGGVRPWC
ncbi:hypothetical protein JOD64_005094 [Micromonospora luteifusca]|uniref:Uncharacterized protein n=1 Tax=Micromonospora luteifusca TaxID=709860 RepID=A0ABS2M0B6_9ACTN|nr:hypothetical protein [Micromonospora luteifusca]